MGWFSIHKPINVMQHMNRSKGNENYKPLNKETRKRLESGTITHVHGLAELIS
jgi:hypothetical protein